MKKFSVKKSFPLRRVTVGRSEGRYDLAEATKDDGDAEINLHRISLDFLLLSNELLRQFIAILHRYLRIESQ